MFLGCVSVHELIMTALWLLRLAIGLKRNSPFGSEHGFLRWPGLLLGAAVSNLLGSAVSGQTLGGANTGNLLHLLYRPGRC